MVCMLNEWEFAVERLNRESQSRLLVTVAMMSRTSHLYVETRAHRVQDDDDEGHEAETARQKKEAVDRQHPDTYHMVS